MLFPLFLVIDFRDTSGLGVETLLFVVYLWHTRLYAGKPGERKWGLPLKGSWGYGNQVKRSGAPTEKILGGSTYSLV
ncbi:hypothetical protein Scep_022068 [Stephania cephalantha]|uniref:Uncharacterized protein n=1 Tax=Stephania cephalantha TaxID=152367 RepID=A0AAP0I2C7_9MAGN